jgi:prepilin-type processing-associated H-X9-DG protein
VARDHGRNEARAVSRDRDRINARHNNLRDTNLLFFDGHAATVPTNSLFNSSPGGYSLMDDVPSSASSISNLRKNFPWPHWRTDQ